MAGQIKPGQWITVKVTAEPKSAAARKTLIRICEKDQTVKTERKRLARARVPVSHIRGGRPWYLRPSRLPVVSTKPGSAYKVFGSVDVLRDLAAIETCVEVTPA